MIYEEAIEKYGKNNQIDVAIEEMSELTKALVKMRRCERGMDGDPDRLRQDIFEEIADVEIMLEQLKIIYDCEAVVGVVKYMKTERLKKRLAMKEFTDRIKENASKENINKEDGDSALL